ncbi:MAG: peroxide stress protein YaaA [Rhodoglobus sp.]
MLLLLPPSETKRDGGADASRLDLAALSSPQLTPQRRRALAALRTVSRSVEAATRALRLGPTMRFEIDRNRAISTSPTMPALERYTGVVYDHLDVATLAADARAFASGRVAIHSALFGLLDADDPIPAYRFSHDARVPGLRLRDLWRTPIAALLDARAGLILDLRSEAYVELGEAPVRAGAVFLRVVTEGSDGAVRALNHFNKRGKGELVRAILESGVDHDSVDSLIDWAMASGIHLRHGAPGEVELRV